MKSLIGTVVRLHSESQPDRAKLYLITDGEYDSYSYGKVTEKTVQGWIDQDLKLTFYNQEGKL